MRLVITGGTGFVGRQLIQALQQKGHKCHILSRSRRDPYKHMKNVFCHQWYPDMLGPWKNLVDGSDGVINLAGESVLGVRWTESKKKAIYKSRIESTRTIVDSILDASKKPKFMISASATGYYGNQGIGEEGVSESGAQGLDFLAKVCGDWEKETTRLQETDCRVVNLRIGLVLHPSGGMLKPLLQAFRWGLGMRLGDPDQWMSWVHLEDLIGMIQFTMEKEDLRGVCNAVTPYPVTSAEFSQALERKVGKKVKMNISSKWIKRLQGEMGEMIVNSAKIIPQKMLNSEYEFIFPDLISALKGSPRSSF